MRIKEQQEQLKTVPRGQTVAAACCMNCGPLEKRRPVLFEPAQESAWPAELKLSEQLLSLPRGLTRVVNIEEHNPTRHDIILGRRTPLGSLHLVQSVTPLEVQRKDVKRSILHLLSALERRMENCAYVFTKGNSSVKQCETATQSQGFKRYSTIL